MFERLHPRTPSTPTREYFPYRELLFIAVLIPLILFLMTVAFRGGNQIFDNIEKEQSRQGRIDNCISMFDGRTVSDEDKIRIECERMYRR